MRSWARSRPRTVTWSLAAEEIAVRAAPGLPISMAFPSRPIPSLPLGCRMGVGRWEDNIRGAADVKRRLSKERKDDPRARGARTSARVALFPGAWRDRRLHRRGITRGHLGRAP